MYHLQKLLKRRVQLIVCGLHRLELGLKAAAIHYTGGTLNNTSFRGVIGQMLSSDVWERPPAEEVLYKYVG